jgi:hypothetical protein
MNMNRDISEKIISSTQYVNEENYWINRLAGELEKTTFPYDFNITGEYKSMPGYITFTIPREIYLKIIEISKSSAPKIFMILTAGLVGLLDIYSYNRNKDIIIGTPIYKQETEEEFINTVLALKNHIDENMSFKELLRQVRQTVIEANENANYPIETLLYQLDLPLNAEDFPLICCSNTIGEYS